MPNVLPDGSCSIFLFVGLIQVYVFWSGCSADCGGSVIATHTAKMINLTTQDHMVRCNWTIMSSYPTQTIAISPVNAVLDPFQPGSFNLTVYDGPSWRNHTKIFEYSRDRLVFLLSSYFVSTGGAMFVSYAGNGGGNMLQTELVYYLCGGVVDHGSTLRSPRVHVPGVAVPPSNIRCEWRLEKPASAPFAYVHFDEVRTLHCEEISLSTRDGALRVINMSNSTRVAANSTLADRRQKRRRIERRDSATKSALDNSSLAQTFVCEGGGRVVGFRSQRVLLVYAVTRPEVSHFFRASFVLGRAAHARQVYTIPWYLNYIALVAFLPLGIVLGAVVISCQRENRRHANQLRRCRRNEGSELMEMSGGRGRLADSAIAKPQRDAERAERSRVAELETRPAAALTAEKTNTAVTCSQKSSVCRAQKKVTFETASGKRECSL